MKRFAELSPPRLLATIAARQCRALGLARPRAGLRWRRVFQPTQIIAQTRRIFVPLLGNRSGQIGPQLVNWVGRGLHGGSGRLASFLAGGLSLLQDLALPALQKVELPNLPGLFFL